MLPEVSRRIANWMRAPEDPRRGDAAAGAGSSFPCKPIASHIAKTNKRTLFFSFFLLKMGLDDRQEKISAAE
jgi:hypothetical protein